MIPAESVQAIPSLFAGAGLGALAKIDTRREMNEDQWRDGKLVKKLKDPSMVSKIVFEMISAELRQRD